MNKRKPHSKNFNEVLAHYKKTNLPLQARSNKRFHELWDVLQHQETPEVVDYLTSAFRDFNALKKFPTIAYFLLEFDAFQGGEDGDEIALETIFIFDETQQKISLNWQEEDMLHDHFWYEHIIEKKLYEVN